jgi:hypothetical protein
MTAPTSSPAAPAEIAARAQALQAAGVARIARLEARGQFYWVKCEERLTLRMRLQKGDPRRAFAAERAAIARLHGEGLPVPPVVAEGPGYFVTPDCGPSLRHLLADPAVPPETRLRAFRAAAKGLAEFHARGLSHGRPSIKDICWDGRRVSFLDLERFADRRNTTAGHVQDLVILLFSAFAVTGRPCPETAALAEAYRAADPGGVWAGAVRLCRRLAWVDPLTRPVQRLRGAREVRAIPLTLAAFAGG